MKETGPDDSSRPLLQDSQLVWQRAMALSAVAGPSDENEGALELLRTARNRPDVLSHALSLGRTHARRRPQDVVAMRATRILGAAIAFLGEPQR